MGKSLFDKVSIGSTVLSNRIAMAPLTRGRADANRIPKDIVADYYAQRASAGLIIAEATAVSKEGAGWLNAPGIYSDTQIAAWKKVTQATRNAGAPIFLQIWHMGRQVHPAYLEDQLPVAPSAVAGEGALPGPDGVERPFVVPRALSLEEIPERVEQFAQASGNAIEAGFAGVEIHAANGFLIEQFLRDGANKRTDRYGGSIENRARFLFEIVDACIDAISAKRVGVRISPTAVLWGLTDSSLEDTYRYVTEGLSRRNIAYLHVLEPRADSGHALSGNVSELAPKIRQWFNGRLILNGGFTRETAKTAIINGQADVIAFGAPFIANPDFVERIKVGAPLTPPRQEFLYTNDAEGYSDYPMLKKGEAENVTASAV